MKIEHPTPVFTTSKKTLCNSIVGRNDRLNIDFHSTNSINRRQTTANSAESTSLLGGPAPSTSVALIILYSITGVITALFLLIIATGAIRAHRHPERYGPRAVAQLGQPRQSRAKGVARAVLDTIPIVRFSVQAQKDEDAVKSSDAEMQNGSLPIKFKDRHSSPAPEQDGATNIPLTRTVTNGSKETPQRPPQFRCPVCMEDFQAGQELRVLRCLHQFHPDCVDPWLLNVSGSCPLCRIDLHPGEVDDQVPTDEQFNQVNYRQSTSRFSRYLIIARGTSGEERMAALRELREETWRNGQIPTVPRTARPLRPEIGIGRLRRAVLKYMGSRTDEN